MANPAEALLDYLCFQKKTPLYFPSNATIPLLALDQNDLKLHLCIPMHVPLTEEPTHAVKIAAPLIRLSYKKGSPPGQLLPLKL